MLLNVKKVKSIVKTGKAGRYRDSRGLYLQITPQGYVSWVFRYARGIGNKEGMLGLGPLADCSLEKARERASEARQQLYVGVDPVAARKALRTARALETAKALTFEQAAQQYFDGHERKWKNKRHRDQFLSSLKTYAYPEIGKLAVADIDTGQVMKVIEPIWLGKTVTADRVRSRIGQVLDWAAVRGFRKGGDNPARWRGHISHLLPARNQITKTEHHPALPFDELPEFMATLKVRAGFAARALEFLILTAGRTGEVVGARWDEIDLEQKIWTVPAGRIKGGREHRVPLSDRAVAILKKLPREADFVFPGPSKGVAISNMSLFGLLRRMGRRDITVHGFRACFRTWAAERTNYPNQVAEMALAHAIGNKVEAAYRRGDLFMKRRRLMADWATYCGSPVKKGEVIPIRRAKA